MKNEIGSEFWDSSPRFHNKVYLLSGRTALEYIITDILKSHTIQSVLLPSYCCHTMIEPFCRHNIAIRFYDVYFDDSNGLSVDIPEIRENEIFYYMTYFGFTDICGFEMSALRDAYQVIIEDRTHSWLSEGSSCGFDYSYVSYRKWTGFSGIALAEKAQGAFLDYPENINEKYYEMREKAAHMKKRFIETGGGDKNGFLTLFGEAEALLESDYVGYKSTREAMADLLVFDSALAAKKRRCNAEILTNGLKEISEIELMYSEIKEGEVPLFVPVLVKEKRTELRKYLIENSVYCPIHWPLTEYHIGISERAGQLYQQELSLVCDQRYGIDDMNRMVELIKNFYKG